MAEGTERTVAEKQRIIALLKQMHLFKGVDDQALEQVIDRLVTRHAADDERIFAEGEYAESFFIILDGEVRVTREIRKGEAISIATLVRGDYFGQSALINRSLRTGTARTLRASTLLELSRENFDWLLESYPLVRRDLMRSVRGYELARRRTFPWLGEDETIHVLARRDVAILLAHLFLPVLLGIISALVLYYSIPFQSSIMEVAGIGGLLVAFLWTVWTYVDWENDYYVVTNKRVVYVEKIILLYDSLQEAPLETIQTINVSSANFIERLLGFGNITVETFGSKIRMEYVRDPARVEAAIKEYWDRTLIRVRQAKDEEVRREVRQRMGLPVPTPTPALPAARAIQAAPPAAQRGFLPNLLQIRLIEGEVITYRRHWFILFVSIWPLILVLAALFVLIVARLFQVVTFLTVGQLVGAFFGVILISSPYWIYQYLDWRDDRYQLTNREVIDLERKPFQQETRDSAPLENILSIQHARDNILKLIFNYGTVAINAGNKELTFNDIYDPAAVQNEIFEQRQKRINQIQADRDRGNRDHVEKLVDLYAEYLPEYLEQKKRENPE